MKKIQIVFTGVYPKFTPATADKPATTKMLYNYVVVDGDVEAYKADKSAISFLSLQEEGEHAGKPRYVSNRNLGTSTELNRVKKQDGTFDWFTDNTEQMLIDSEINALPDYAKSAIGAQLANEAIARARATANHIKAMKAVAVDADLKKS
jgi:hypothetical protein